MSFFIAVLFACASDGCAFMQSKDKHFSQSECGKAVEAAVEELKKQLPIVHGVCLHVTTKDLV